MAGKCASQSSPRTSAVAGTGVRFSTPDGAAASAVPDRARPRICQSRRASRAQFENAHRQTNRESDSCRLAIDEGRELYETRPMLGCCASSVNRSVNCSTRASAATELSKAMLSHISDKLSSASGVIRMDLNRWPFASDVVCHGRGI